MVRVAVTEVEFGSARALPLLVGIGGTASPTPDLRRFACQRVWRLSSKKAERKRHTVLSRIFPYHFVKPC